jgi:hypothetical protein
MPPSSGGNGQLHSHLQALAGLKPTNLMQQLLANCKNYAETTGANLWRDLIILES